MDSNPPYQDCSHCVHLYRGRCFVQRDRIGEGKQWGWLCAAPGPDEPQTVPQSHPDFNGFRPQTVGLDRKSETGNGGNFPWGKRLRTRENPPQLFLEHRDLALILRPALAPRSPNHRQHRQRFERHTRHEYPLRVRALIGRVHNITLRHRLHQVSGH